MKKIYLMFPLIGLFLNSCLDLSPISEIGEDNFFKNDSEVLSGVNACYNGLHAPLEYEWMLTDLRTDISRVKSKSSQTSISKDLMALDESKASASLVEIEEYWNATYNNIYRCNTVLKNINNVEDETKHKQYEGEALFIRAYHYFNLVRLFGPVFKITNTISADEVFSFNLYKLLVPGIGTMKFFCANTHKSELYQRKSHPTNRWFLLYSAKNKVDFVLVLLDFWNIIKHMVNR